MPGDHRIDFGYYKLVYMAVSIDWGVHLLGVLKNGDSPTMLGSIVGFCFWETLICRNDREPTSMMSLVVEARLVEPDICVYLVLVAINTRALQRLLYCDLAAYAYTTMIL